MPQRRELARRRNQDARTPGRQQRVGVARAEVHSVAASELVPRQRVVVAARMELAADRRDRPLTGVVDEREAAALRRVDRRRVDGDPTRLELLPGEPRMLVVSERGEEVDGVGELRELYRRSRPATRSLLPRLVRVDDLARPRHGLDRHELEPLDMAYDGGAHPRMLTNRRPGTLTRMMEAVTIPPFERFYDEHRTEVLRLLRRRLGVDRADDAFQETFLRALRAYGRLEHGEHLRAWVLTIAQNVALDMLRRARPTEELVEAASADSAPAYAELADLTDGLGPKERAAVVLRYGYDLSYDQIASVLGSSPDAARQATSTGVRRIRRRITS